MQFKVPDIHVCIVQSTVLYYPLYWLSRYALHKQDFFPRILRYLFGIFLCGGKSFVSVAAHQCVLLAYLLTLYWSLQFCLLLL